MASTTATTNVTAPAAAPVVQPAPASAHERQPQVSVTRRLESHEALKWKNEHVEAWIENWQFFRIPKSPEEVDDLERRHSIKLTDAQRALVMTKPLSQAPAAPAPAPQTQFSDWKESEKPETLFDST